MNNRGRTDAHLHPDKEKSIARTIQNDSWERTPDEAHYLVHVIDVDETESMTNPRAPSCDQSAKIKSFRPACKGYILQFPEGQTPHSAYPFGLHDLWTLPWDYSVCNGVMTLYARGCSGFGANSVDGCCEECKRLEKNPSLEGIRTRFKDGVHENAPYAYHGTGGYQQL